MNKIIKLWAITDKKGNIKTFKYGSMEVFSKKKMADHCRNVNYNERIAKVEIKILTPKTNENK